MLPINISDHAREKLLERVGVSPRKLDRLVRKAWLSTEPIPKHRNQKLKTFEERKRPGETMHVRRLMGWDFFFGEQESHVCLITVIGGGREARSMPLCQKA